VRCVSQLSTSRKTFSWSTSLKISWYMPG
jgi:hypothetical protein